MDSNLTGNKLTHMTHMEDMLLNGPQGISLVINALDDTFNALEGHSTKSHITLKADGRVSVICASNFNGQTFVATKGFFAKTRKYATTEEECYELWGENGDLAEVMSTLLKYLPSISIPYNEIWQGDFLFSQKDLNHVDGNITFKPNTIIYSIPENDPIDKLIEDAKIGIVWHTRYRGSDFDDLKISFDVNIDEVNTVKEVFQMDPNLPSIVGTGTLTLDESIKVSELLEKVKDDLNELITSDIFPLNSDLILIINTLRNALIRMGKETTSFEQVRNAVITKYDNEISKLKTEQGKQSRITKRNNLLNILDSNKESFEKLFAMQNTVAILKNFFIDKLNHLGTFNTMVQHIEKGYLPCGQEGFAVSDAYGNVIKLVSRLEFSANNFSKEIVKGWTSEKREKEGNNLLENYSGEEKLYKWAIVDSPDEIDEKLYKKLIAEKTQNFKSTDKEDAINFIQSLGYLTVRSVTTATDPEIDVNMEIEPTTESGMDRGSAGDRFLDDLNNEGFEYSHEMLNSAGKHLFVVNLPREDNESDIIIKITFKDPKNNSSGGASTTAKEELYAISLNRYLNEGENYITDEEYAKAELTPAWESAIINTNDKLYDFIVEHGENPEQYYVSREKFSADPNYSSVHNFINKASRLFGYASKDTWNPADIVILRRSFYNTFVTEYQNLIDKKATLAEFNQYLYDQLMNMNLLCVSLKKNGSSNISLKITGYNSETAKTEDKIEILSSVRIPYPAFPSDVDQNLKGCYINKIAVNGDTFYKLNYRTFGNNRDLQVTPSIIGHDALNGKLSKADLANLFSRYYLPVDLLSETIGTPEEKVNLILDNSRGTSLVDEIEIFNKEEGSPFKITFPLNEEYSAQQIKNWLTSIDYSNYRQWPYVNRQAIYIYTASTAYTCMLIRAYKKGDFQSLMNTLIKKAGKETMLNAPYIKVY